MRRVRAAGSARGGVRGGLFQWRVLRREASVFALDWFRLKSKVFVWCT